MMNSIVFLISLCDNLLLAYEIESILNLVKIRTKLKICRMQIKKRLERNFIYGNLLLEKRTVSDKLSNFFPLEIRQEKSTIITIREDKMQLITEKQ